MSLHFHNGWVSCDNIPSMVQQYAICTPLLSVSGLRILRPNAVSLEELKMFFFVDDNIIANLATILQLLTALCTRVIHDEVVLGRLSFIFSIF